MARDSSPFAQRLKALAIRAGLPVDDGQAQAPPTAGQAPANAAGPAPSSQSLSAPPTPPAADEQPTGEFPAVRDAESQPGDDLPTGEFPAVPPVIEMPAPPPAAEAEPRGAVPPMPIWMDSPAHEQAPPAIPAPFSTFDGPTTDTTPASSGPTLPPPVLSKPTPPADPAPADPPVGASAPAETEADGPLSTDAADAAPAETQEPAGDSGPVTADDTPSTATALDHALRLPADEAATETPEDGAPTTDPEPAADAEAVSPEPEPGERALATADRAAHGDDAPTPDAAAAPEPAPAADSLSLTARFAAIRQRVLPTPKPADATAETDDTPTGPGDAPEPAAAPTPEPEPAPSTAAAQQPIAETIPAKPSFAERAALRRRVKTLRARRDTGLLELGAILLDQRRFGDPTSGALLRRRTDELGDLDNEIATIEQALDSGHSTTAVAALGTIRCLGCSALVGPGDRFCVQCGTPRPPADDPDADAADHAS